MKMNDRESLVSAYESGVDALRKSILGMRPAEIQARPIPGKWSVHEVVCHLADFEIIGAERIKRVIAEDRPTFFNAEPEPFAANLAYPARDSEQELMLIAAIRRHVATILKNLRPEQWQRSGNHSTDGPLTVEQLVKRIANHIPHHVRFIDEKRAAMRSS
jgi:hypothetical protein